MSTGHIEIEQWLPSSWSEIVGNRAAKSHFLNLARGLRLAATHRGVNTLVYGPSRTGKTSLVKLFIRAAFCELTDPATIDPCSGNCPVCREEVERFGIDGIFAAVHNLRHRCITIDCTRAASDDVRDAMIYTREQSGIRIVYLDELHSLTSRGLEDMLLKPIEERGLLWIASTKDLKGVEEAFLNRFAMKIRTEAPTATEMVVWLSQRCKDWGISCESKALDRLVQRSKAAPGLALQVVAVARMNNPRKMTMELVEDHVFPDDIGQC
jgi:replication-associated recombination protein RarA